MVVLTGSGDPLGDIFKMTINLEGGKKYGRKNSIN